MDHEIDIRPISAPAKSYRPTTGRRRSMTPVDRKMSIDIHPDQNPANMTLAETMHRFHTSERMERHRERRKTEHEIDIIQKPSIDWAPEMTCRKFNQNEMDNVVARVGRPTAAYSARIASIRRRNPRDIYVPPPVVQVHYYPFEGHRFRGNRSISARDLKSLVDRLSAYNPTRKPPESVTPSLVNMRRSLGPVVSYRWKGLRNC